MNADLLAMLGGGGMPASGAGANRRDEGKSVLSFKAGKMTTALQPNGKYRVTPDARRGEIHLVWTAAGAGGTGGTSDSGHLKFEWRDRRTRTTVDSLPVFADDRCTYHRIQTGKEEDRVYLLQYGNASDRRFFFWMQDKDSVDDENRADKVRRFLANPAEAGRETTGEGGAANGTAEGGASGGGLDTSSGGGGAGGALDNQALQEIMQGFGTGGGAGSGSGSGNRTASAVAGSPAAGAGNAAGQVDALSSILENLGMPQGGNQSPGTGAAAETSGGQEGGSSGSSAGAGGGGTLTLADLQGAMAGLNTASPPTVASPAPQENNEQKDGDAKEEAKEAEEKDDTETKKDSNGDDEAMEEGS